MHIISGLDTKFIFKITAFLIILGGAVHVSAVVNAQTVKNKTAMQIQGTSRYISSNGVPDHAIGRFPVPNAPYKAVTQDYVFRMPKDPVKSATPVPVGAHMFFGVALNGVPIKAAAEKPVSDNIVQFYNTVSSLRGYGLDENNGHPDSEGRYHYHGIPAALLTKDFSHIGYAADGFPIFVSKSQKFKSSYRLKDGLRGPEEEGSGKVYDGMYVSDYQYIEGAGNLDRCNGVLVNKKYYIYILTDEFPKVPPCWSGTPDASFKEFYNKTPGGASTGGKQSSSPGASQIEQFNAMRGGGR